MEFTPDRTEELLGAHCKVLDFINEAYQHLTADEQVKCAHILCANLLSTTASVRSVSMDISKEEALDNVMQVIQKLTKISMDDIYDKMKSDAKAQECDTSEAYSNP